MALEAKKTLIMRIYQILEEYSDSEHPLKYQDIIDILRRDYGAECERKAIARNISYLKEIGYEIESDAFGTYLAVRPLEKSELRILIDSVLSSRHINSTHSEQLINKLITLGGHNFKNHVKHVYSVKDWDKSENRDFFLNVEIADEAIENGKKISFAYNKIGTDKKLHCTRRHVASPYQMLLHNQRYYLMLRDDLRETVGFFRMDKITDMQILDEPAVPIRRNEGYENGINYKEIATAMPYMYSDKPINVAMRCQDFMADALFDWFGNEFSMQSIGNGQFIANVKASKQAMLYWALQYNKNVEIISPLSLKEEIINTLKETLELYNGL